MTTVFAKRREVAKTIPKFWAITLLNSPDIAMQCQHADDRKALSFLEDVWVERDPLESRAFTLEFVSGRPGLGYLISREGDLMCVCLMLGWWTVLQGEPVLLERGAEEGVQVHPPACRGG